MTVQWVLTLVVAAVLFSFAIGFWAGKKSERDDRDKELRWLRDWCGFFRAESAALKERLSAWDIEDHEEEWGRPEDDDDIDAPSRDEWRIK